MSDKKDKDYLPAINDLHELINHFFDDPFTSLFHQPFRVDVYDMGTKIVVAAELQGFDESQIKIEAVHEGLKIVALVNQEMETIDDTKKYYQKERSMRRMERVIPLPYAISASTKAFFKDGILEVHIPKNERKKQQYIDVE